METNLIIHTFGYDHYKIDKAVADICTKVKQSIIYRPLQTYSFS